LGEKSSKGGDPRRSAWGILGEHNSVIALALKRRLEITVNMVNMFISERHFLFRKVGAVLLGSERSQDSPSGSILQARELMVSEILLP
jgi:hypothetical protein